MNRALDVAKYIITHENKKQRVISNLRLQKLLYFVQAQFLSLKHEPCFCDRMEAWDFGPVVPNVYHEYKIYGSSNIPDFSEEANVIDDDDRSFIDLMLETCGKYSTTQLVSISHHQRPWKDAYAQPFNNEITPDAISSYFLEQNK